MPSPLPATMRALEVASLSGDFSGCRMIDMPLPRPAAGQALVRVRAVAINFPDILMTRGQYQLKPDLPFIPGSECAGEVVAVGSDLDAHWLGQPVIAGDRIGVMADYALVSTKALVAKPATLDWAVAASYRAVYLTAYVALVRRAYLAPGEWLLVHGAAGGTGLACVDLGRHLGARVIAASASARKLEKIAALHPGIATLDTSGGFRDAVKAMTGGRGADVIFDPVGGDVFDESTRCTAFDGRLLVIGFTSGRIPSVPANIPLIKGFSVVGVRAGEYGRQFPDRGRENIAAIDALAADGAISPHVGTILPLDRWRDAMALLLDRQAIGKVVLAP